MSIDKLVEELENKNEEICLFFKRYMSANNIKLDNTFFDLLAKKLQNHDKLLIESIDETNKKIEKIAMTLAKHIK